MLDRRALLASLAGLAASGPWPVSAAAPSAVADRPGAPLSRWQPGTLDIHHLATGRGDATLIVSPSGAMALIDAGDVVIESAAQVPARPDASRRAGEWIARYAARRMLETGQHRLEALVITHLHPDHVGGVRPATPWHPSRSHRLTGASDVANRLPVGRLLDPDWPDYGRTAFEDAPAAGNYAAFARHFDANGGSVIRLEAGSDRQILNGQPGFSVRTLAVRGQVWTTLGGCRDQFAPAHGAKPEDAPRENDGSAVFLVSMGRFRWFGGGDLTDWADAGTRPWLNALTPAAQAAGPVDVAVLGHHGMFDAGGAQTLAALAARAWIVSAWHALHPSPDVLARVFNPRLYAGPRDVYATALHAWTRATMPWLAGRMASSAGHVIVRVAADGAWWRIVVTDYGDEADTVRLAGTWLPSGPGRA